MGITYARLTSLGGTLHNVSKPRFQSQPSDGESLLSAHTLGGLACEDAGLCAHSI